MHWETDPDRLLAFFDEQSTGSTFKPSQQPTEIKALYSRVLALRPQSVLEIGTNCGGTLFLFCRAAAPNATIISLDLPQGRFGGGYHPARIPLYRSFASPSQRIRLLRMDSHQPAALARVQTSLRGKSLDFLFIDGDHTYEGVRKDFYTYGPLIRDGGLIAFHDIVPVPLALGGEVPRFWGEIKARFPHQEFIQDPTQNCMGIGLIEVPPGGLRL